MAAKTKKKPLGKVPADAIRMLEIPRLPKSVIKAFAALTDLTGTISDAMDAIGLVGAIPASVLRPALPGKRMVGQAITVRNVERREQIHRAAREGNNTMGETEAYNLAEQGDVIVIEGLTGCSNMGGQSATIAHREGCAGAVIDGSFRDPDASREAGFPIWSRGATQITGKWRLQTVEINGAVHIAGVQVRAGDLVCADEAGVCFVPREHLEAVLAESRKIDSADDQRKADIARGVDVAAIVSRKYK